MPAPSMRRLGVWIGALGLAGALLVGAQSAQAGGSAALSPSTAANTDTAAKIAIATAGQHQAGSTVVDVVGAGDGGMPFEDAAPTVAGQTVTATINFVRNGVPAGPGTYTVEVCDLNCSNTATMESFGPFAVSGATPTLSTVSPVAIGAGVTVPVTMRLTGSGFATGSTVAVNDPSGSGNGVTVTGTTVKSPTTLTASLTTSAGAPPGPRTVAVTNTDGHAAALTHVLVVDPAPTFTSPTRIAVGQGATDFPVTLRGSGFQTGAIAAVTRPSSTTDSSSSSPPVNGITLSEAQHDSTSLPLRLTVSASATPGSRTITVTNPDGGTVTVPMTVDTAPGAPQSATSAVAPTPMSVTPASVGQGASGLTLVINGSGFVAPAHVDLGPDIAHGAVSVGAGGSSLKVAAVTVSPRASSGSRDVDIINGDGGVATCTSCIMVDATTLTAVQPPSLQSGDADDFLSLVGAGYGADTKVSIPGVTVKSVAYKGPAQPLSVEVAVGADAQAGLHPLTMTDADGGTVTCRACFSVDDLKVGAVKPGTARDSGPVTLTIHGKRIPSHGIRAELTPKKGIVGQDAIFASHSHVSASRKTYTGTVQLAGTAPGDYDVRLVGPKHAGTCVCTLTVTAGAPTLTAVSPGTVAQGDTDVPVVLTGGSLSRGATVSFPVESNVTAPYPVPTYVRPNRLAMRINVASFAQASEVDVTVTAADGQAFTCKKCLTIQPHPTLANVSAVSPSGLSQGANKATVTVSGSNFTPGSTLSFAPGITVEGTPRVTPTTITATVDVAAYTTPGSGPVTVTDIYQATGQCAACLSIAAATTEPGRFFLTRPTTVFSGRLRQRRISIAGTAAVPADADAVLLQVTMRKPSQVDALTVWPAGQLPGSPSLRTPAGVSVEQDLTTALGTGGAVSIRLSSAARVRVVVVGYYRRSGVGATFVVSTPRRVINAGPSDPLVAGTPRGADLSSLAPAGADGVLVDTTVSRPSASGAVTVKPAGGPVAGAVRFSSGGSANGTVVVPLGSSSRVEVSLSDGAARVGLDVVGWYVAGDAAAAFTSTTPQRVFATSPGHPLTTASPATFTVSDTKAIPANATAALLRVTAINPGADAVLTASPVRSGPPGYALALAGGTTTTAPVVVPLDDSGSVRLSVSAGQTALDVETIGYFR